MSENTAKTTDPIWDSRNSEEPPYALDTRIQFHGTPGEPTTLGEQLGIISAPDDRRWQALARVLGYIASQTGCDLNKPFNK